MSKKRENLMDTSVFSTTFIFQDIYEQMEEEQKEIIDSMTDKQLQKFINENLHSMQKGMTAGIMHDWDAVAETVASNLNY